MASLSTCMKLLHAQQASLCMQNYDPSSTAVTDSATLQGPAWSPAPSLLVKNYTSQLPHKLPTIFDPMSEDHVLEIYGPASPSTILLIQNVMVPVPDKPFQKLHESALLDHLVVNGTSQWCLQNRCVPAVDPFFCLSDALLSCTRIMGTQTSSLLPQWPFTNVLSVLQQGSISGRRGTTLSVQAHSTSCYT
jgi:hypothetical protein